jgi:hypothetical protein
MTRIAIAMFFIASASLAQDLSPIREIRGAVLDAESGSPIARATVELSCTIPRTSSKVTQVLTDTSGVFKFTNIPSSTEEPTFCSADVSRIGYLPLRSLSTGADPVVFKLVRQNVIAGIVVDENGQPLPYAHVTSFQRLRGSGFYAARQPAGEATTDDSGRFRIVRLAAGSYRVCVEPPRVLHLSLGGTAYQRLCYPERSQDRIPLKTGETRELHFDFKPIPGFRVSGHLSNATRAPYFSLSRETAEGFVALNGDHDWNPTTSTFVFPAVIPGEYLLTAQSVPPPAMWASKRIVVGPSGLGGLELILEPHQLEGVIKSEDDSTLPAGFGVAFGPANVGTAEYVQADQRGVFKLAHSDSRAYRVQIDASPWHLQSIKQAGYDITGRLLEPLSDGSWGNIEIVASRSQGSIQGTLRAATDQSYLVLLLQERSWGFRLVTVSRCNGQYPKFEFNSLPAGEYRILASKVEADIPYLEPSYIASRAGFVAIVRVADGQTSKVEVTPVLDDSDSAR